MPESPVDVIRRFQSAPSPLRDKWTFLPGISDDELKACEENWRKHGQALSEGWKELIRVTAGIKGPIFDFSFESTGDDDLIGLFPGSIIITSDDTGNFWMIDTAFDPNRLGPVFFVCHDPAVIVYQAYDLASFLDVVLNEKELVATDMEIWRAGAGGGQIQGDWVVFDLQSEVVGKGAPQCLYYDEPNGLQRVGNSLVFRAPLRRNRTWWQRFRDRWR